MTDEEYMREAFKEVEKAVKQGGAPFGVVVVDNNTGDIIWRDHDRTSELNDPTAHGEINAIRGICKERQNPKSLSNTSFYVSCMPCATCFTAMVKARVGKLVYGPEFEKTSSLPITVPELMKYSTHPIEIVSGVLEQESINQRLKLGADL